MAWDFNRQRDGIDFHETELLEWSIVSVPAITQGAYGGSAPPIPGS
jgi:hypothetical protein